MASVATLTVPSVPTAMGSTVGTVTDILVAAGSPPMEPSAVLDRLTAEVAVPPLTVASLEAAEAEARRSREMDEGFDNVMGYTVNLGRGRSTGGEP